MPKKTFFNIPIKKQKIIIDIAIEEFTSKSFEDVNVKSIAKKANISRGSFYTYFEDLDELFNYIIIQVREDRLKYAKGLFKESNGDYFLFIKKLFSHDFDAFRSSNKYSLFRNYIHYVQTVKRGSLKELFFNQLYMSFKKEKDIEFADFFNLKQYRIQDEKELLDLLEVTFLIMIDTYFKSETENLNKEEIISLFERRISIIEHGVKK